MEVHEDVKAFAYVISALLESRPVRKKKKLPLKLMDSSYAMSDDEQLASKNAHNLVKMHMLKHGN